VPRWDEFPVSFTPVSSRLAPSVLSLALVWKPNAVDEEAFTNHLIGIICLTTLKYDTNVTGVLHDEYLDSLTRH
jgi:hypothetical protein